MTLTIVVDIVSTNDRCTYVSPKASACVFVPLWAAQGVPLFRPATRMRRCHYHDCQMTATNNVKAGSKRPVYCMIHVEGSMTSTYLKPHALDAVVNVRSKLCSHVSCTKRLRYNAVGGKKPAFCKQHTEDSVVDAPSKRCFYDSCTKHPSFNLIGSKTAAYCKKHADDGKVDVISKRCVHE